MTLTSNARMTNPMTAGQPIGPDLGIAISREAEVVLTNADVTFAGVAPDGGSARAVHWLTQMSSDETVVAAKDHAGGGRSVVYVIHRTDDQGRTWSCVTSPWWTAGLFLSAAEALNFGIDVARRETPDGGWDYCAFPGGD